MPVEQQSHPRHSEEIQEFIRAVPHWLVRWGISVFFILLFLILVFSAFLKSPDIVAAKLSIDAEQRPQEVLARQEGKLVKLFVKENQQVTAGHILGLMESNADHFEVLRISRLIDSLNEQVLRENYNFIDNPINRKVHYGELQPSVQEFYLSYLEFLNYIPGGVFNRKYQVIREEIKSLKLLSEQLTAQQKLSQQELALATQEYEMQKKLAEANVISVQEFRQQESKLLSKKLPMHNMKSLLISNDIDQNAKLKELAEAEHEIAQQRAVFLSSIQRFKSELDNWKKNKVLTAEMDGRVVFQQVLSQNQRFHANETVMHIMSLQEEANLFGKLTLGQHAFGKVEEGQQVLIRLSAYPAQEYGLLRGRIRYISDLMSGDTSYTAVVDLPDKTTYGKSVRLHIGLEAQAEVVTNEKSILEKVFNNLHDVVVNR